MLKLIVSFALIAAALGESVNYYVDVGTNHVTVGNDVGYKAYFYFNELTGSYPIVKVDIIAPQGHVKTVEFEEVYGGHNQIESLHHIFSQYAGHLDRVAYKALCDTVFQWVQMNQVHPIVFHALNFLDVGYYGHQYGHSFSQYGQGWLTQGSQYPYGGYKSFYGGVHGYQPYGGAYWNQPYGAHYGSYQKHGSYGPYAGVYGHGFWGSQGPWGKSIYGQGPWGQNVYGQHFYGQHYPQNYLTHYQGQLAY